MHFGLARRSTFTFAFAFTAFVVHPTFDKYIGKGIPPETKGLSVIKQQQRIRLGTIIAIGLLMATAAAAEFAMGRHVWGTSGTPGLWSGDIWSSHNSQFVADPYSLTHVSHGVVFYGLLSLAARALPLPARLLVAVGMESAWEVLENTNMVIERYRTETISLNYFGDSVVNSMGDILACILGFTLASRLPKRVSVVGVLVLEILLVVWTRDNLALNVIMLIHPSRAIRLWQLAR
jgi:hypothetical protein